MDNFTQIIKEALTFLGKKLDAIANKETISKEVSSAIMKMSKKEMPDVHRVSIMGAETITIKGDKGEKGDKGDSPTDEHLIDLIDPLIPAPIEGKQGPKGDKGDSIKGPKGDKGNDGSDGVSIKGDKGDQGKPGKDGSPDTGSQIIAKINSNKTEKIKASKVEGFDQIESMARTAEANSRLGLRAGGDTVYLADLSSSTDGVTKVFTLPINPSRIIMVTCSDFPTVLFLNNGFTRAGGVLTLTVDNAPSQGSQLGCLYVV